MTDEYKKRKYAYNQKYKQTHYKRVSIDLIPEEKERWEAVAKKEGKSLTGLIRDLMTKHIINVTESGTKGEGNGLLR